MNSRVETYFEALHVQVILPHARWSQFLQLFTISDSRMQLLSRTAPGFFAIVRDVIRDDAFIALSRLTDKPETFGQGNLSFVALIEAIEADVGGPFAERCRDTLTQLLTKVAGIRLWRNKVLAHADLHRALQYDPEPVAKVQRGDIDEALRLTRQLLNDVAAHLGKPLTAYDHVVVPGDASALLEALEAHPAGGEAAA